MPLTPLCHEDRQHAPRGRRRPRTRRRATRSPGPGSRFSASSTAFSRPSITSGLIACILVCDAGDQHLAVERPDADLVVLVKTSVPAFERRRRARAEHGLAEVLALVDRQRAARHEAFLRRRSTSPRACARRRLRPPGPRTPTPAAARLRQRLAGVDVFLDPLRHLRPAGLPARARTGPASCRSPSASRSRRRARSRRSSPRCTAA